MKARENSSLRAIIVDDEEPARLLLREYLGRHPDVTIISECANGFEAVKAAGELRPNLLFLDVQMPKLDGFETLELIDRGPAVVFVTAYDEYALRAFDVHAVDYLLKPFGPERLDEALSRARERLRLEEPRHPAHLLAEARARLKPIERILVRDGSRVHIIPVDKLDYAEARDDYVELSSEGRSHLKQQTLAELESLLDPSRFVRVHRSFVMNVERLARVELYAKGSRLAILKNGKQIPVSRSGYARLKEIVG